MHKKRVKGQQLRRRLLVVAVTQVLAASAVSAATLIVQNPTDNDPGSLRQAVADANSGDTIVFNPVLSGATIVLEDALVIDKDLIISGDVNNDQIPDITISGGNPAPPSPPRIPEPTPIFPVVVVTDTGPIGPDPDAIRGSTKVVSTELDVTLDGLIITDGLSEYAGGGILNIGENLTVSNSVITGNRVADDELDGISYGFGGGIATYDGNLTISNSTISNNSVEADAFASGGGIAMIPSKYEGPTGRDNLIISNSVISGNTLITTNDSSGKYLSSGGGIFAAYSQTKITDSLITGNTAGGIEFDSEIFSEGFGFGGGISSKYLSNLELVNSTVSGNTAVLAGGVGTVGYGKYGLGPIFAPLDKSHEADFPESKTVIDNSTIFKNHAIYGGGLGSFSNLSINKTTISTNTAVQGAAGMFHLVFEEGPYGINDLNVTQTTITGNELVPGGVTKDPVVIEGVGLTVEHSVDDSRIASTVNAHREALVSRYPTIAAKMAVKKSARASKITTPAGTKVNVTTSIIANSVGGTDCYVFDDDIMKAPNLVEDGSCGNNVITGDPKLGPLQDNGGPVETHELLPGSRAILGQPGDFEDLGATGVPYRPVPTLSEWTQILLAGFLGLVGYRKLRRRLLRTHE